MKLLTFTTLYPNTEKPTQAIFVENRLRHLLSSGEVKSKVLAPVPWFPLTDVRYGRYASFARVPAKENRFGIDIVHPRYPLIPKIGMNVAPLLMAAAARATIARMLDEGEDFDLIDAHYFYPDGVAAVLLGKYFNKPVVITARGSDISLIPRHMVPRKQIQWAARHVQAIITVCNALKAELVALGVEAAKITPLRNGVDLQRFVPVDRTALRLAMRLDGFTLLSAGHLLPVKGHDLVIASLPLLPDVTLLIAGDGAERAALEHQARDLKVSDRVRFLGNLAQPELAHTYAAVDALVLASSREGWANVLLEAMACGTPVVASRVWGTPEVVAAPEAGVLMPERSARGVADGVNALRAVYPVRADVRRYAEGFSWDETTAGQVRLFKEVLKLRNAAELPGISVA